MHYAIAEDRVRTAMIRPRRVLHLLILPQFRVLEDSLAETPRLAQNGANRNAGVKLSVVSPPSGEVTGEATATLLAVSVVSRFFCP